MAFCILLLLISHAEFSLGSELKLSDSKLLLPYYSNAVINHTIAGTGGLCYEWWSGTNEVVSVAPIGEYSQACSNKAVVTAVWQSALRATSTVYAREQVTGKILKCDVIVDDIHSITIATTTQELFLHNTPEALEVIGYDEFGNVFSTLDGIPFEWKIHASTGKKNAIQGSGVLRFLSWTESEYATPPRIGSLEFEGMQGYMQLVSGLRTGSALVSASLVDSTHRNIQSAKVRLLVMANAQLTPPVLYLIPNARALFRVHIVRQDNDEEVSMPSRQYYLSVADTGIIDLNPSSGSSITALTYGHTTVTLLDKNVEDAIETLNSNLTEFMEGDTQLLAHHRHPTSIVNVVEPAYFRFSLNFGEDETSFCTLAAKLSSAPPSGQKHSSGSSGNSQWSLESLKTYLISLDLYDQDNHRIFPSDNLRIKLSFSDSMAVEVITNVTNGTLHLIRPLRPGPLVIKAKLFEVIDETGKGIPLEHPTFGSQEVLVYSSLGLLPNKLNIAWGNETADIGYALKPSGGSGEYLWTVLQSAGSNSLYERSTDVIGISSDGRISQRGLGTAIVVVSDLRNPDMCSQSIVKVSEVSSLAFATKGRHEVFLPRNLDLAESLLGSRTIVMDAEDLDPFSFQNPRQPLNPTEKQSNSILAIGMTARDTEGNVIHDCHNMALNVKALNPLAIKIIPGLFYLPPNLGRSTTDLDEKPCAFFRIVGLNEGFTELETAYDSESYIGHKSSIRFPIAVYRDIEFLSEDPVIYVAVGSSRRIWYKYGPLPWNLDPSFHFTDVHSDRKISGTSAVPEIKQAPGPISLQADRTDQDIHSFVISCESSGAFNITVIRGNQPIASNPKPAVLASSITLLCEAPTSLHLIPYLHLPVLPDDIPKCPFANRSLRHSDYSIPVPNTAPVKIETIFKGPSGHELSGIDSIATTVSLSSESHAIPFDSVVAETRPKLYHTHSALENDYMKRVNPYFYVTPKTPNLSVGSVNMQVIAKHQWPGEQSVLLEASLSLKLSPPVQIEPSGNFQLLYHPNAVATLHFAHGSGFFHLSTLPISGNVDGVACISLLPGTATSDDKSRRDYSLTPNCQGKAMIKVIDLCFPATAANGSGPFVDQRIVSVVNLASLRLYTPTQIELNQKADAYVRAFDTDGNVLPAKFSSLLDLSAVSSAPSVDVVCENNANFWLTAAGGDGNRSGLARFNLCGHALGTSMLKITSNAYGLSTEIHSNVVSVNVFLPLRLEPCNFNLLKGATHQITASGGPSPRSIEFSVSVDTQGLLKTYPSGEENSVLVRATSVASPKGVGVARVNAKLMYGGGYTDLNTSDFTFWNLSPPLQNMQSRTSCQMNVVALSGIRIGCPLPETTTSTLSSVKKASGQRFLMVSQPELSGSSGVPVWAEGIAASTGSIGDLITPMGMSDVKPPLHFSWRLTPPMPSSPAVLVHWLNKLNVEPDDINMASGLVLVGLTAGQVKLHLSVFTDERAFSGQLIDEGDRGKLLNELSAELVVTIVPNLNILSPFRLNPKVLVSPNSKLQLRLPVSITSDQTVQYSVECPVNQTNSPLAHISSAGLLQTARNRCGVWSSWRLENCRCRLQVSYGASSPQSRGLQSLSLDLVVKPPLYLLAHAISPSEYAPQFMTTKVSGLPFGGPYQIGLSFHDDMGDMFDAVNENLLSLHMETHWSNLLDYSVTGELPMTRLNLRLVPPLYTPDGVSLQPGTTLHIHTSSKSSSSASEEQNVEEGIGFASSYLSVPTGTLLDTNSDTQELVVGQWKCLKTPSQGSGRWSSSDSSVVWIDAKSAFMLPLRPGRAHIFYTFTSPAGVSGSAPMSLLGRIYVVSSASDTATGHWLKLTTELSTGVSKESFVMPVGLDTEQEFALQIRLISVSNDKSSECVASASPTLLRQMSEMAPFACSVRLEHGDVPTYLPSWLRSLLLAEDYSSILVPSNILTANAVSPSVSTSHFSTRLVPSNRESGTWTCLVQTGKASQSNDAYFPLASLQRDSRLVVDVKWADDTTADVVSSAMLRLVPGFRVIAPPMHFVGSQDIVLLTGKQNKANILIFIPPATLVAMEATQTQLKARSQRPDILAIDAAPRPLFTPEPLQMTLERLAVSGILGTHRSSLLANISRLFENEAQVSIDQALGNGLIWILPIRSLPTKTAVDIVVEVIIGLKTTNQHVSVPIRVQTSPVSAVNVDDEGVEEDSNSGYWVVVSWLHIFLLFFLTCLLLLAAQLVIRSSGVSGYDKVPYTPPKSNLPPIQQQGSTPALWSQGLGSSHQSPMNRARQFNYTMNSRLSQPAQPVYGGFGDTPRQRDVDVSPSRLREAFDNSL